MGTSSRFVGLLSLEASVPCWKPAALCSTAAGRPGTKGQQSGQAGQLTFCTVPPGYGHMVMGWNYTRIDDPDENGYRIVANEDGCWLYDRDFNKVLPDTYDAIQLARGNEGVYVTKNHVKQLLDFEGKVLEPFIIDRSYKLKYMTKYHDDEADEYELVTDILVYRVDRWEGLMDARTGKIITPAKYWSFEMISKDLISAELGYGEEGVVMDKRGGVIKQ